MKTTRITICCLLIVLLTFFSASFVAHATDDGFNSGYIPDDEERLTDDLYPCNSLDKRTLSAFYQYTSALLERHSDAFDAENLLILQGVNAAAENLCRHLPEDMTPINEACTTYFRQLQSVEAVREPDDCLAPKTFAGIYAPVYALLRVENEWDAPPLIDYTPLAGVYEGYYLVHARSAVTMPLEQFKQIGGYIYEDYNYYYPSELGYLLINPQTGDVLSLEDGLRQSVITGQELYRLYLTNGLSFRMRIAGDSNRNGKLDIADATLIQKKIAHIADAALPDNRYLDCNDDKKVDITDVTVIQRHIAEMDAPEPDK
ncbi:MAG: dockerin type I repeat-containing protein [Ruminococcus sp.]|nr:dockerin type I repeat-containing protein [Ruminococcus sp.]